MFRNVLDRLLTEVVHVHRHVNRRPLVRRTSSLSVIIRGCADVKGEAQQPFDSSLLEFLVCPLSKKPLRRPLVTQGWFLQWYESKTNELINEELGIAYPIIDGIPNMIPQEARLLQKDTKASMTPTRE